MAKATAAKAARPVTAEGLQDEVRFVLKTLLRDDLFGDRVSLTEAEKLLDNSLSIPFADYCGFLRGRGLIELDRAAGTIEVNDAGKAAAVGGPDPSLIGALAAHFSARFVESQKQAKGAGGGRASPKAGPALADPGVTQPIPVHREAIADDEDQWTPPPAAGLPGTGADLPPEARPPDVGPRYDLETKIGDGSLGVVWRAKDLVLDRPVALKQMAHVFEYVTYIPQDELRRRLKEASLAHAGLTHPHVLEVVDLDFSRELPHVVTRFAAGGDLGQRLSRAADEGGVLPADFALRALLQCAHGLAYLHGQGVVHGGLKPENLVLDGAGNVLLADLGLARVTEKGARTGPPVYVGAGATSYMAPEQLHDEVVSPAGDVYALGILLYQMLTGGLPGRRSPMPSEKNKKAPKGLDDVFDRMTQDDPEARYPDGAALVEALCAALPKKQAADPRTLVLNVTDPWPPKPEAEEEKAAAGEGSAEAAAEGSGSATGQGADGQAGEGAGADDGLLSSAEAAALADIPSEELPSAEAEAIDDEGQGASAGEAAG